MNLLFILPVLFLLLLNPVPSHQQKVAFTAYFDDGGVLENDIRKPIRFNKLTANVGNGYDPRTGVFTAPVSGVYLFILSAKASSSTEGIVQLGIHKQGVLVMQTDLLGSNHAFMDQTSSFATMQLLVGDKVTVRFVEGPPTIDKWYETSLTGILLFPD